ncbi:MAG: SMC-Scp complex subunit ScpB [Deltaproteobacteria bacterium]|jgi:segregation and condensation protein B|nr:SMC-Scp complex subunit ScpB [Deltaproteobacteria bacterium]MBW1873958.1 SMC-Scp complex subunit ScpB [Deltaproteobacteria bacterium]MBW2210571.1 SMC-Scp complex subunit ScpB [Deltaproteobacteria bacterium]MBW2213095.1 SMC-Scp complex subunit ScpB [Deltaproteobacteria bacterium]MBW2378934.1 SMC-Scp complex subunit ScpB [Deltaproteobacteria bacterium]
MTQTDLQTDNGASENGAGAAIAPSADTLKNVIESLIFVSGSPLTPKRLARAARATLAEVQPLLDELVADYEHRGVHLYYVAGGYQFRSARESADFVKTLVAPKPMRLTRAQLETLAIVAYRQPLTRPEVDDVRGVDSGSSLKMLTDRGLVRILGRKDEPGRPLVYGTTPGFLEFFGLSALKDLPTLQEFSDLTDEHKALFEEKTGESIDIAAAEIAAAEAMEQAEEELLAEEEAAIAAAEALAAAEDEEDGEDDEEDEE